MGSNPSSQSAGRKYSADVAPVDRSTSNGGGMYVPMDASSGPSRRYSCPAGRPGVWTAPINESKLEREEEDFPAFDFRRPNSHTRRHRAESEGVSWAAQYGRCL